MNEEKRLLLSAVSARTRAYVLRISLSFLRNGRRDLALELFEDDLDCPNVAKAVEYLKRRQRPLALEALETELDQRIVDLGALPESLEPSLREMCTECLREVRDYRRENPRRFEADLGYFAKEALDKTRALWDQAEKILSQIPDP